MKQILGLLQEPVEPPVNLKEIYNRVREKQKLSLKNSYKKHKNQRLQYHKDRRLFLKLESARQSAYCRRCRRIISYPITDKKLKQHRKEFHAY